MTPIDFREDVMNRDEYTVLVKVVLEWDIGWGLIEQQKASVHMGSGLAESVQLSDEFRNVLIRNVRLKQTEPFQLRA